MNTPRHLNPVTAQFPAIVRPPRHAAPETWWQRLRTWVLGR